MRPSLQRGFAKIEAPALAEALLERRREPRRETVDPDRALQEPDVDAGASQDEQRHETERKREETAPAKPLKSTRPQHAISAAEQPFRRQGKAMWHIMGMIDQSAEASLQRFGSVMVSIGASNRRTRALADLHSRTV
jgi:hypothetical protein